MKHLMLALTLTLVACGTDEESYEPPKNALCKILKDGTVDRHEIDPNEQALRRIMADMGYTPCY